MSSFITIGDIFAPINFVFIIAFIGICLGKIKIFSIKLDISAVLIVAVIFGILVSNYNLMSSEGKGFTLFDAQTCSIISVIGSVMFISCIGLKAGGLVNLRQKQRMIKAFLCGVIMVVFAFLFTIIIMMLDATISKELISGIFSGAMTSTPALSASCELFGDEGPTTGYGISYILGTFLTVTFVQLLYRNQESNTKNENNVVKIISELKMLSIIFLSSFVGSIVGEISIFNISIGRSGGVLFIAIIIGLIIAKISKEKLESPIIERLGLIMFFVGKGIPAGINFLKNITPKYFVYGGAITLISIMVGYIISKHMLRYSNQDALAIVCGGMTSTPAISALNVKSNNCMDTSLYTMSYIGALITLIGIIKILLYV